MAKKIREYYMSMYPHKEIIIDLCKPGYMNLLNRYTHLFKPVYEQLLSGRHGFAIQWASCYKRDKLDIRYLQRIIIQYCSEIANKLELIGRNLKLTWDDNTHARVLRLSEKYLLIRSIDIHIEKLYIKKNKRLLQSEVRNDFIITIQQ